MSYKISIGRFKNIPVTFKYPSIETESNWELIQRFTPFQKWIKKWEDQEQLLEETAKFHGIEIEDLNLFRPNRIGFLKFRLDARWKEDGAKMPGIVFMRGDAVAVLLVLHSEAGADEPFVVMVQQPRIPVASMAFLELPAGMVDDDLNFHSVALKELKEECGIEIRAQEMIPLGAREYAVSPGGSDEFLGLYLVEKTVSQQELQELEGRLGGLREEGERIKVTLVKLSQVVKTTRSLSVLAAIALYNSRTLV